MMNNANTIYKDSPLGKIPSDWEVKTLGEVCLLKGEYGINASAVEYSDELPTYIRITDINDDGNYTAIKRASVDDVNSQNFLLKKGDIVFARTGATVGKTYLYNEKDGDLVFAGFLIRYRPDNRFLKPQHLNYFTSTKPYWDWVKRVSMRSGQPGINAEEYSSLKLLLPPLSEQTRIAEVLSTWDKAISNVQATIEQVELRNKWLMQELLTGKRRLKGFGDDKWKIKSLKEILIPVRKSLIPQKDELYQQIGIRSHTKGIFYKDKVSGATLGDKRVFWIEPNCFIVNIVFAWEHAIAKTTENETGMIASHRFPMFKPKNNLLDIDYLLYYFKSPRGKSLLGLASPGGAGRNKTLGQSEFINLQIQIPSLNEQIDIAQVLQAADKEVQVLRSKLNKLKEQKKGLMQVLLTGKKRLKIV